MRKILITLMLFIALSCQKGKQLSEEILIPYFDMKVETVTSINQLFGKQAQYTALETNDESLVGKIGKIVKRKNYFFILSEDKQILQFAEDGHFIAALKKQGNGPGEYTMITDFNIYINNDNELEIWLSDFHKIRKYRYVKDSWNEFSVIDYPYVINKFHIIDNERILLLTGQNDNCLTISDRIGKEMKSYLKSEIPFLVFKPVQFIVFQNQIVFQKGVSNDCVSFSASEDKFVDSKIIPQNNFLSSQRLQDLFSKYESYYLRELQEFSYLRTLRNINGQTLIESFADNNRHIYVYNKESGWKHIQYDPKNESNDDFFCLTTIGVGDGLNSFIMFKYGEDENDNPIIVEY